MLISSIAKILINVYRNLLFVLQIKYTSETNTNASINPCIVRTHSFIQLLVTLASRAIQFAILINILTNRQTLAKQYLVCVCKMEQHMIKKLINVL